MATGTPHEKLTAVLVDGHYLMNRAFHTPMKDLRSPDGEPTKATYVFFKTLFAVLQRLRPDVLAVAIDGPCSKDYRRSLYPLYKANRLASDPQLSIQRQRIYEVLYALGLAVVDGGIYEADDVIATLSSTFQDERYIGNVYVVSRDKDMYQLVGSGVRVVDPGNTQEIGVEAVWDRFGVSPEHMVPYQALAGDSVDGIPGVRGIGAKKAANLVRQYKTLDAIRKQAKRSTGKMWDAINDTDLDLMEKLVTLRTDLDISDGVLDLMLAYERPNMRGAAKLFDELGFRNWGSKK